MSRRNRPNAFEVSFGEKLDPSPASKPSSQASSQATLVGSRSGTATPLKRPSEGPEDHRPAKRRELPAVRYYKKPRGVTSVTYEDREFILEGEDPDSLEEGVEEKPIRILDCFAFFDPKHRCEMLPLDAMEKEDRFDRQFEAAGFVRVKLKHDDDEVEEDPNPPYLRLGAVLRFWVDLLNGIEPVWIETECAWYILDEPDDQYRAFFQHFYVPISLAQMLFSAALQPKSRITRAQFVRELTQSTDIFGRTWQEEDLHTYMLDLQEALEDAEPDPNDETEEGKINRRKYQALLSNPAVIAICKRATERGPRRRIRPPRCNQPSPKDRLIGDADEHVLLPENQNTTHVTPFVASLVEGLIQEDLKVVGAPLPTPSKAVLEKEQVQRTRLLRKLVDRARQKKVKTQWHTDDQVKEGSVGDVILVTNDTAPFWTHVDQLSQEEIDEATHNKRLSDFFWFAIIRSINRSESLVHIQWLEHGCNLLHEEQANPQELFYTNLCCSLPWNNVLGKVTVHWHPQGIVKIDPHEFYCRMVYDQEFSSFVSINREQYSRLEAESPPENCPACQYSEMVQSMNECRRLKDDNGVYNGFTYRGHKYHLDDFVLYVDSSKPPPTAPANIGYIIEAKPMECSGKEHVGYVTVRKVGRIVDLISILPSNIPHDERHLFLTDETQKVSIEDLRCVVYAPCRKSLEGRYTLDEWVKLSSDHFYLEYNFPRLERNSWRDRVEVKCEEHRVCTTCWKEKLHNLRLEKQFLKEMEKKPLKTLDVFAGVLGYSKGLSEGSGCMEITHAIEISPSAAQTAKRNSPKTVVINQCANAVFQYAKKSHEGFQVAPPVQLWDSKEKIPSLPPPGSFDVIVIGFPCQAHSALNMYKKASDVKNNLVLNAISYIQYMGARIVYLENVMGFMRTPLNARQASPYKVQGGIEMGALKVLIRALLDMGYQLRFAALQAGHYGTPQGRERFILVAALPGTQLPELPQPTHAFPSTQLGLKLHYGGEEKLIKPIRTAPGTAPHHPVTTEDSIGDLAPFDWVAPGARARPRMDEKGRPVKVIVCDNRESKTCGVDEDEPYHTKPRTRYQMEMRQVRESTRPLSDLQHFTKAFKPEVVRRVTKIPRRDGASVGKRGYKVKTYARVSRKGFFHTIVTNISPTAKQSSVIHYIDNRILSIRELARAQGFPDDFVFVANKVETIHRLIGNAVPIPLGKALGRELRKAQFEQWKRERENAGAGSGDGDGDDDDIYS
ncbi:hypothetical protein CC1G_00579 [Coprinopsis cinerea okayama7|uniref:DNA (cytosine-5-)-methyltransferase n=1 Tax=Coprinopsis cinerea (strain Okayama-7 / 130 / ATCC MYA-4618 / FGSC 9003) TaxID=240176 RepID=A8N3W7_COPC7|nr:hypothetical protein CC1G_00579 [Coprinopsis cinerea okayama7\|eukprot:XP_001829400.2 hypothetical protein CC1G_00579 [Coprinopsis cinerea okayama7\